MALENIALGLHCFCRQQSNLIECPKGQLRGNCLSSNGASVAGQPFLETGTPHCPGQRNSI